MFELARADIDGICRETAGRALVVIDEAHDPASEYPFKGNVDLDKLDALVRKVDARRVPYISIAATVNMAGGQPISMGNLHELRAYANLHGIQIVLDATRAVWS